MKMNFLAYTISVWFLACSVMIAANAEVTFANLSSSGSSSSALVFVYKKGDPIADIASKSFDIQLVNGRDGYNGEIRLTNDNTAEMTVSAAANGGGAVLGTPQTISITNGAIDPSATVKFHVDPKADISGATVTATVWQNKNGSLVQDGVSVKLNVYILPVEFITPAGDPAASPQDGAVDGQNEFTFDNASPGKFTINLKAKVTGASGLSSEIQNKFVYEVDSIGSSTLTWDDPSNPGQANFSGDDMTATVDFEGLPNNNSDFGANNKKKKARIKFDGTLVVEQEFEVFFLKNATNHPSSSSSDLVWPNWYYYWKQSSANFGTHQWNSKNSDSYTDNIGGLGWKCFIGQASSEPVGAWDEANGIDTFANVCRHEDKHKNQMSAMWGNFSSRDPLLDQDENVGDYLKDQQEANLIPGHSYDKLKKATYPDTFNYDPGNTGLWNDNEDYCMRQQPAWTKGDANKEDWSNPGMQHKTLNNADD